MCELCELESHRRGRSLCLGKAQPLFRQGAGNHLTNLVQGFIPTGETLRKMQMDYLRDGRLTGSVNESSNGDNYVCG